MEDRESFIKNDDYNMRKSINHRAYVSRIERLHLSHINAKIARDYAHSGITDRFMNSAEVFSLSECSILLHLVTCYENKIIERLESMWNSYATI